MKQTRKSIIQKTISMPEGSFPFTYLEAPLSYKKLVTQDYYFLLSKVLEIIASWNRRLLSTGGKLTLIQSV